MATRQNRSPVASEILLSVREAVSGRWAISLPAWLVIMPIGILVTANSYSPLQPEIGSARLNLFGLVGVLAAGFVLWVANISILRNRRTEKVHPALTLTVYALAGVARSSSAYALIQREETITQIPASYQLLVALGAIHGIFWLTLLAVLLNLADRYRQNRSMLADISQEIVRLEVESEAKLREDLGQVEEMIKNRLQPVLTRVNDQLSEANSVPENLVAAAADLQEICNRDVRSLSHKLSEPVTGSRKSKRTLQMPRWRVVFREGALRADTYHFSVLGIATYLVVFMALAQSQYTLLDNFFILMAQTFLAAFALDFGFWRRVDWKFRYAQVGFFYLLLISIFAILMLNDPEFDKFSDFRSQMLVNGPVAFGSIWILVSFLRAFEYLETLTKNEIEKAQRLVDQTQKNFEQKRNKVRKSLASILHGKIQGRLSAVSLAMISSTNKMADLPVGLLDEAETQIRKVQIELDNLLNFDVQFESNSDSFSEFSLQELLDIVNEWGGLLEVNHNLDQEIVDKINRNYLGRAIVVSISESLSNAVRHGRARMVWINFFDSSDGLELKIRNDGLMMEDLSPEVGHGGREIASLGGSRTFEVIDGQTVVTVSWKLDSNSLVNQ
jgi:signal transduction histidine kinase